MKIVPVILLGGAGTRLWPISRKNHPKQFLNLIGDQTLLQDTISRLSGIKNLEPPIVVCNETHRFTTAEQLYDMGQTKGDIILEPVGRNTAPAVATAALRSLQKYEESILLVLPADHVIQDKISFQKSIEVAINAAKKDFLVTLGIVPDRPETGYGYIKRGEEPISSLSTDIIYNVERFIEKPNIKNAQSYIQAGNYLWNSGMFLFKASIFLSELEKFNDEIYSTTKLSLNKAELDLDFIRLNKESFDLCPSDSIDYAIMEKTEKAVTVPLKAGWSDIGSWDALWEIETKDLEGNVLSGDVLSHNSQNCLAKAENKLVTLVGVNNLVVIETKDAILVASKDKVQDVKNIVERLTHNNRSEATLHREVYRPWGKFDGIDEGERFQVKRITVKPGEGTSLQMHHHRAEHWIIVSGIAEITCNDKTFLCYENQSAFIPQGSSHCIANPGKLPMEMIEVQTGSYLGEDDIIRIKDRYGRSPELEDNE